MLCHILAYRNQTGYEAAFILVTYSWVQDLDKEQFLPRKNLHL